MNLIRLAPLVFGAFSPAWGVALPSVDDVRPPVKASDTISSASALLAAGEPEQAITILRAIFSSKRAGDIRFNAALLLASFGPGTSAFPDRAVYAEFVLSHPLAVSRLKNSDRIRLLRSAGLGWFSLARWPEASLSFEKLRNLGGPDDGSLSELHLGWIELNQKNPKLALQRWLSFLGHHQHEVDQPWGPTLIRDLGHVWIEAGGFPPEVGEQIDRLIQSHDELKYFREGMSQGLGLIPLDSPTWASFRGSALKTRMSRHLADLLLKNPEAIESHPCEILDWIKQDGSIGGGETQGQLFVSLQNCLKSPGITEGENRKVLLTLLHPWMSHLRKSSGISIEDRRFALLHIFYLQNEPDLKKRQEWLEKFYPSPSEVKILKNGPVALLWLEVLQRRAHDEDTSMIRKSWIDNFLENPSQFEFVPIPPDDLTLIALQISQQEQVWLPIWNYLNRLGTKIFTSERVLGSLHVWLTSFISRAFLDGSLPPEPSVESITQPYFNIVRFFIYLENQFNQSLQPSVESDLVGASCLKDHLNAQFNTQSSPIFSAYHSTRDGITSLKSALKIKIKLESSHFFSDLKKQISFIKSGSLFLRKAGILFPPVKQTMAKVSNLYIDSIRSNIQAIEAPNEWSVPDQESWRAQRKQIADGLNEWRAE